MKWTGILNMKNRGEEKEGKTEGNEGMGEI